MKLSQVFVSEELTAAEKIEAIAKVVKVAKEKYGNADQEISIPGIPTTEGTQELSLLTNESKIALAESEVQNIRRYAVEFSKENEGVVVGKKIEELIALSALLTNINITAETESEYI